MDNNTWNIWISYLAYTLFLLIPQLDMKIILFTSKGNGFPKCEDPSFPRNGTRASNFVSRLSLKSNIELSLPLLLHSRASEEMETSAACKMSANLETVGKTHTLKLKSLYLSRLRYQNVEGTQCNITLEIAITSNEKDKLNNKDPERKKSEKPLQDFPGAAKIIIPELTLPTIDYVGGHVQQNFVFLYTTYELRNYKNECSLQFQEFTFTEQKNETPVAIRLNSYMCKSRQCSHNISSTGKPKSRAMTKVFISCLVFFAAILFTGCFVMICTCSSLMKLCENRTRHTEVN